ncbi:MAG: 50S ribosomal protein L15 [Phycisphaerae bacterium]|nr:50S ribosomal protein L15 [Phycisphaerae bacterium]
MNLTDIKGACKPHKRGRRLGRGVGSGRGKTSGRGHKGSGARAGRGPHPLYEGGQTPLYRRLPKVGFSNVQFATRYVVVNVGDLGRFRAKSKIDVAKLREAGLVSGPKGTRVKVLGGGELAKSLTIRAHAFSASARDTIAKAGGTAEVI